ncbi:MAG TPA: hypothetical protein GX524_07435 [Firmicutes bacterium]|nr:hypothetical protein [Bacillota bacterium]
MRMSKPEIKSYFEIEISKGKINVIERAGNGKTDEIIDLLEAYGLRLTARVSAPCG